MNKLKIILLVSLVNLGFSQAQTEEKKEETERDFQVTFFPPIGTNGVDALKITNKFSLNIFAGAAKGLNGIELGGFVNYLAQDMKGAQCAGFVNVVLRDVKGVQGAGFVNYSGGNLDGAALAGFVNVNLGNTKGGQFSGFCNANLGTLNGGQFAGFVNYNQKNLKGMQAAGYVNVNLGDVEGGQVAGFVNIAKGDVQGGQVGGFVNYAKKVKGLQLGVFNFADSVDGASIGFCSFVKKGLHQVEVSGDELFYTNLSFRTGTQKFYNIFSAGTSPQSKTLLWHLGYGIGTSFGISEKLRSDISLSAHHVSKGLLYHATSELYKFYWGIEYKLAKKCFVAAGPTFNVYLGDALLPDYAKTYSRIAPYSLLNETNSNGFNFKAWVGGKIAFRFL